MRNPPPFSVLIGKTLIRIARAANDESVRFDCDDGQSFELYHDQDCCESVGLHDVIGDMDDLIGTPILVAEERSSSYVNGKLSEGDQPIPDELLKHNSESDTWTFYTLRTVKGTVDLRWWGASNGYSESVDFRKVTS